MMETQGASKGPAMLYQVLYSSRVVSPLGTRAMRALLAHARRRNALCGITGVLLHYPESAEFVQVLEGDKPVVVALLARIRADPRHRELTVHYAAAIARRNLEAWPMGFLLAQSEAPRPREPGAVTASVTSLRLQGNAAVGMRLLHIIRGAAPPGAVLH